MLSKNRTEAIRKAGPVETGFMIICLLIIPAIFTYEAFFYFDQGKISNQKTLIRQNLIKMAQSSENFFDENDFWQSYLSLSFKHSESMTEFVEQLENAALFATKLPQFIVWRPNGKILKSNFSRKQLKRDGWQEVFLLVKNAMSNVQPQKSSAWTKLRQLFGSSFHITANEIANEFISAKMANFDVNNEKPRVWIAKNRKGMALALFPKDYLDLKTGQRAFFKQWKTQIGCFAIFKNNQIVSISDKCNTTNLLSAFHRLNKEKIQHVYETKRYFFILEKLGPDRQILLGSKAPEAAKSGKKTMLMYLSVIFCFGIFFKNLFYGGGFLAKTSVGMQICIFLFIVAGIPSFFVAIPAIKHFSQKKTVMIDEKHAEMTQFLQNIDRSSQFESSRIVNDARKIAKRLQILLTKKCEPMQISKAFTPILKNYDLSNFLLLDQKTDLFYEKDNYMKNGKFYSSKNSGKDFGYESREMETLKAMGDYLLGMLNQEKSRFEPKPDHSYVFEMFFQKSMEMFINRLIDNYDQIFEIGWGSTPLRLYPYYLRRENEKKVSVFFQISLQPGSFDYSFIRRNHKSFNSNPNQIKVIAKIHGSCFPENFDTDKAKDYLFGLVSKYPSVRPVIVDYNEKKHLFSGLRGNLLRSTDLIALFPLENIDHLVSNELRKFLLSAASSLLLVIITSILFYGSLLRPVKKLQLATQALNNRKFNFRIGNLSQDEFGEMAEIFDESMADFEELELASMVQSRLFPKTRLNCGNYYVFGKSVPMAQLGGDYFDYFLSKQGKLCILMGDVAGHGVGSSLIMAMAKAGVIYQGDRAEDPAAMLKGLHQMILHTRNKSQRKIMTFQYLCLDADLEAGKYANAGGCAPLLVDINKKSVCEINLTAPVLGGFKNSHYANISVDLKAGQAIIFYTDGIIESRNRFNEELGYERFQQMALNCWEEEPENYYQRLYDACIAWRGEVPAQDDMTMVILQRKKNNGKYCC